MMDDRDVTRRAFIRGRVRAEPDAHTPGPIAKEGQSLPSVISWLDPEMRATPRRGSADGAFPLLRPPGAVEEAAFLQTCTRCGDCAEACPHAAIAHASERFRTAEGSPIIDPLVSPCLMCEDFPCIAACETGALRPEAPAALGSARLQPLDCLNHLSATCSVCVERCPIPGAIAFAGTLPAVNEGLCTGCGICQHVCPAPQNAILMLPNSARPTPVELDARLRAEADDSIELPELRSGELDAEGLRVLFRDLEAVAQVDEVRLKSAARSRAEVQPVSLQEAYRVLAAGEVRGAQIRYRYQDESWCDTILLAPSGYRVVRMAAGARPDALVPPDT